ncbi:hypothetical protein LI90_4340 (plasmid) [Carbonactinospora thermoautotrophica]|uniref:Uncharacterized protein n=1 Tax=Carbonactinospora thermoautotrophica TaxID=1469144 RepID=A0A132MHQ9_9ACTN|nr:hypothetical protein [Carbonactinospora thermoautotrophica]KWW97368.1 hypothetical protein LI90_4340 [Carbonactinospora thermoautotrophica]
MGLSWYNGHSPEKRERVARWLEEQWTAGTLPRPSRCIVCDQTEGAIHGHLEDYDQPTSYVDLCITCHLVLHARFRRPAAFIEYRDRVARGWQAPPLTQRVAWVTLNRGILAGRFPPGTWRDVPPGVTFLDGLPLDRGGTRGQART